MVFRCLPFPSVKYTLSRDMYDISSVSFFPHLSYFPPGILFSCEVFSFAVLNSQLFSDVAKKLDVLTAKRDICLFMISSD